jgi:hypothetical protein
MNGKWKRIGRVVLAAALAAGVLSCDNALQEENDRLKGELADKEAQMEALEGEKTTAETAKAAAEARITEIQGEIAALNEAAGIAAEELAGKEAELAAAEEALEAAQAGAEDGALDGAKEALDAAEEALAGAQEALDAKEAERAAAEEELAEAKGKLAEAEAAIALQGRQISVLEAGGQLHGKDWFDAHDANVAAAAALGNQLALVFIGDKVIADLPVDNITNKPEYVRFKIAGVDAKGTPNNLGDDVPDNAGDLLWRLNDDKGESEMPAKGAIIVSHIGQRLIEQSGLGVTDDGGLATELGYEIGKFHAKLRQLYPDAGHISSGIIPSSSIGANNTGNINNQIQGAIGGTNAYNQYIPTVETSNITSVQNGTNILLASMSTNVAMSKKQKQLQQIELAAVMQSLLEKAHPELYKGPAQLRVAKENRRYIAAKHTHDAKLVYRNGGQFARGV